MASGKISQYDLDKNVFHKIMINTRACQCISNGGLYFAKAYIVAVENIANGEA